MYVQTKPATDDQETVDQNGPNYGNASPFIIRYRNGVNICFKIYFLFILYYTILKLLIR
jgi:hypothetical protein